MGGARAAAAGGDGFEGFPDGATAFFVDLAAHNDAAWFAEHRDRYHERVRDPMRSLVAELEPEFGPMSLSRPNRDARFAHGRDPYKTEIYARSRGRDVAGWYVQLSADGVFAGGGAYMPDRARLAAIRSAIDRDATGRRLERILDDLRADGYEVMDGGGPKTAPRGYPVDHPRIALLRMVHVAAGRRFAAGPWLQTSSVVDRVADTWRALGPLTGWLHDV